MAVTLSEVQNLLVENQILDIRTVQKQIAHLQAMRKPLTVEEFASALVNQGILTRYQARAIYHGKGRALVLNNYLVLDKIGVGGMGRIYRAKHLRMNRIVALKILPPEFLKQPSLVQRFQREVQAAARLHHPNIVMAFDADFARGVHYMVMEYVEGTDLSALVKQHGTVSIESAIDYISQAACGLEYAHLKDMIHRDIKPGNIILDSSGTIKILDMGLVLLKDSIRHSSIINLTKTNVVMGTVDFMSPEQAMNSKYVDERGDIYSLGMTLYYLLVGKPAYRGETAVERLLAHRDAPLPSLMEARNDVDSRLESIFHKMIAKKPNDRYQSVAELNEVLNLYLVGTNADPILNSDTLNEDEKLDAFLVSLKSVTSIPPRSTVESSKETQSVTSSSTETDHEKKVFNVDLTHDQESILGHHSIESDTAIPTHVPSKHTLTIFVFLGAVAVVVILILLYQLETLKNTVNTKPVLEAPESSNIEPDTRRGMQ